MNNSCVIHPRLSNGEKSPLFTRLKNFLGNTEEANSIYYRVITPEFKSKFPTVRFDDNNEPLFEDLITKCGIGYNKTMEDTLKSLNREYGTSPVPMTMTSSIELQNKAGEFNTNTSLDATAVVNSTDGKIKIDIIKKDKDTNNRLLGRQQRFNAELNSQLIKLLNSWGADVGALTQLEEDSNINGVMDLNAALNAATGLKEVIRISKRHRWSSVSKKENVLSEEEQAILKNAPRDSQGRLLAPNGKLSNLTQRQYAQVRTKEFKDWFGDWENDPENASKVVDENGEPRVMYHGSPDLFDTFSYDFFGRTDPGDNGRGFYFAYRKEIAKGYGNNIYPVFLNVKHPFIHIGFDTQSKVKGFNRTYNPTNREILQKRIDSISRKIELDKEALEEYKEDEFHISILNKRISYNQTLLNNLQQELSTKPKDYLDSKLYDTLDEYDGVMEQDEHYQIVVRNSNQIKSATDNVGTFDANNDDIRFMKADTFKQELLAHRANKVAYDNLSQEEREYLALRKVSEKDYEALNTDQKEILLHCM